MLRGGGVPRHAVTALTVVEDLDSTGPPPPGRRSASPYQVIVMSFRTAVSVGSVVVKVTR